MKKVTYRFSDQQFRGSVRYVRRRDYVRTFTNIVLAILSLIIFVGFLLSVLLTEGY